MGRWYGCVPVECQAPACEKFPFGLGRQRGLVGTTQQPAHRPESRAQSAHCQIGQSRHQQHRLLFQAFGAFRLLCHTFSPRIERTPQGALLGLR